MKRFLKIGFASLAVLFIMSPAPAYAVDVFDDACNNPATANSPACQGDQDPITGSEGVFARVTSVIALIAGIIAVVIIIIGGFMYVTAGSDSGKTKTARDTIIYAAVGLAVIALAQSIIMFIISRL